MNRYVSEQLMTVEEAERLSGLDTHRSRDEKKDRRNSIWAWQTVAGALDQTVSDEQVDEMVRSQRAPS